MSMSSPFEPHLGQRDEEIAAADPGTGAPPSVDGSVTAGEEPDRSGDTGAPTGGAEAAPPEDPPFRAPDPRDVGRPGRS